MKTFMIPEILRSRFDRKQSEREAESAKQETEAEKQRRQQAESEDRQRKLIAASVDGDKIPAKDADWLAEQYESDLDFERDAKTYIVAKKAAERLQTASDHDHVIQACRRRVVEIDELIAVNDYKLTSRIGDTIVRRRGSFVARHDESVKQMGDFIKCEGLPVEQLAEMLKAFAQWESLKKERHLLSMKAEHCERMFNLELSSIEFDAVRVDPYSNNSFPLSFALSGESDSKPLKRPVLTPCPLRAKRKQLAAEQSEAQAKVDHGEDIRTTKLSIERAQAIAHGNEPAEKRQEAAKKVARLKQHLAEIT